MSDHTTRTLPDGTVLSPGIQGSYQKWAAFAHNVGSERAHNGHAPDWMEESLQEIGGMLYAALPMTHADRAWGKLLEYAKRAQVSHDSHPDLCDPCTRQWLAGADDEFWRSGLNGDLHDVLTGVAP